MTPNDKNLKRLEDFLASTEHQTKEESLIELAANGVDVAAFQNRVNSLVRMTGDASDSDGSPWPRLS